MDRVKKSIHYYCSSTIKEKNRGKGVGVVVFDTGAAMHPDIRNQIVYFKDLLHGRSGPYDDCGHGTHVCGIIAGNGKASNGKYAGMASAASLIVLKVLGKHGEGNVEDVLSGIRWVLENHRKYRIRIANLSVGAGLELDEEKERKLLAAVEAMWDAGIAVIVSAGNLGPGEGTITIPGNSKKVITVGAMERTGKLMEHSGRGPTEDCIVKPDIITEGQNVISCNHLYVEQKNDRSSFPYSMKSGTSMATPVVSGAAALYYSKYPEKNNAELKLKLRQTSERSYINRNMKRELEEGSGWGSLRVDRLLEEEW